MIRVLVLGLAITILASAGIFGVAAQEKLSTEAVCLGLGGDGLSLVRWSTADIAAWEARTGLAAPRAHPETGTCEDPSGLPIGANPASHSYLCSANADGMWFGPGWVADVYRTGQEMPPDPETGGCPLPRSLMSPRSTAERQAAATAVYLSQLEAEGDYGTLYEWLHPDGQAVVPRAAVVGWYTDEWAPRGSEPITVERVRFVDWTWPVTGARYGTTAEVTFRQRFADGPEVEDRVRLVQTVRGGWRWFFGRDRAFVEQQIEKYGG